MDNNFLYFYDYLELGQFRAQSLEYWISPSHPIKPTDHIVDLRISAMLVASGCLDAPLE